MQNMILMVCMIHDIGIVSSLIGKDWNSYMHVDHTTFSVEVYIILFLVVLFFSLSRSIHPGIILFLAC